MSAVDPGRYCQPRLFGRFVFGLYSKAEVATVGDEVGIAILMLGNGGNQKQVAAVGAAISRWDGRYFDAKNDVLFQTARLRLRLK
ncbi:hypothetical protein MSS2_04055 [Mycobacterium marinum]|nr:hypothetical protein MSS2_04055 [Mycobacterium marinum]